MNRKRHTVVRAAIIVVVAMVGVTGMSSEAREPKENKGTKKGLVTGKGIGDFDFLAGQWAIKHRRLKDGTQSEWQEFESRATVHRVLNGMGSIEELQTADGGVMGMGVRVWHPAESRWADHWTSGRDGVVNAPQLGQFIDGEGVFTSEEVVDGVTWLYRGVWDRITPTSCRWHQSSSKDGGKTWEWNWFMDWSRQK